MKGMRRAVAATLAMLAVGSGGPPPVPDYVTSYALNAVDLSALSGGHLGILKAAAPSPILYLDWRLLNGLAVGKDAGSALARPRSQASIEIRVRRVSTSSRCWAPSWVTAWRTSAAR